MILLLSIILSAAITGIVALLVDNRQFRKESERLRDALEEKDSDSNAKEEVGVVIVVEYNDGTVREIEDVKTLHSEDSGIVLRHSNGHIVANLNPSKVVGVYSKGHLKTEEEVNE